MAYHFSFYSVFTGLAGLICFLIALAMLTRRHVPGAIHLNRLLLAVSLWSLTAALEGAAVGIPGKVFWSQVSYIGVFSSPMFFLLFAAAYAGEEGWLTPRIKFFLWIIPFATIFLAFTNEMHHLIWTDFIPIAGSGSDAIKYVHGAWFWVAFVYVYLLLIVSTRLTVEKGLQMRHLYRQQSTLLILSIPFPWLGNLMYMLGTGPEPGLDYTPIGFGILGILLALAVYRYRFMDLMPVTRDKIIDWMKDGLMVVDEKNRLVDINQAMVDVLKKAGLENHIQSRAGLIGKTISEIFEWNDNISQAIARTSGGQEEARVERDGRTLYFNIRVSPLLEKTDASQGKIILFHDITEIKNMQQETEQAKNLAEALRNMGIALGSTLNFKEVVNLVLEQAHQVAEFDYACLKLLDGQQLLLAGVSGIPEAHTFLSQHIAIRESFPDRMALTTNKPVLINNLEGEARLLCRDSRVEDVRSLLATPIFFQNQILAVITLYSRTAGQFTSLDKQNVASFANHAAIALQNARLFEQMERMAITDSLTGLYTRRHFSLLTMNEIERSKRNGSPLSVIMMDLDYFKQVNDCHGHLAGDEVLQQVAEICRGSIRMTDSIGRYGGEEFIILLPSTDGIEAYNLAERLRENLENMEVNKNGAKIRVTASLGIAELGHGCSSIDQLFDQADQALYVAKRYGRNRSMRLNTPMGQGTG